MWISPLALRLKRRNIMCKMELQYIVEIALYSKVSIKGPVLSNYIVWIFPIY